MGTNNKKKCDEIIIDKNIKTFCQYDYVNMHVVVGKANYGEYLCWHITCDRPCKNYFDVHPFRLICDEKDYNKTTDEGEIVPNNDLLLKMFEHITKTDEELSSLTGTTSVAEYRAKVIKSLTFFWD